MSVGNLRELPQRLKQVTKAAEYIVLKSMKRTHIAEIDIVI
jgi:hypothetical protein